MTRKQLVLLHGTSDANIGSIELGGLREPYLTDREDIARYFAEEEASIGGGSPVILKMIIRNLSNLRVDQRMWEEPLMEIKEEHDFLRDQEWREAVREGMIETPENEKDWQTSLKMVHSVIYEGTIGAADIVGIKKVKVARKN